MTSDELRELAHELHDRDEAYALITVVRAVAPTSAYVGAQAIVLANGTLHGWIGGGCAKNVVIRSAQSAIEKGEPKLVRISNDEIHSEEDVEQFAMACASDGSIELFIQPYSTQNLLCVLGDSPAANEARFLADRLRIGLTDDATEAPIVLVATQGQGDEDALETALQGTAKHVLLIASRRKADKLRSVMRTRGIDENQLARLHAPAGPDAGAKTPEEIALAAMVGVLAIIRGHAQAPEGAEGIQQNPAHDVKRATRAKSGAAEIRAPAEEKFVNPVCGTAVSIAHAMHVEIYEGESYYFCCDGCWMTFIKDPKKYAAIQQARSVRLSRPQSL